MKTFIIEKQYRISPDGTIDIEIGNLFASIKDFNIFHENKGHTRYGQNFVEIVKRNFTKVVGKVRYCPVEKKVIGVENL